MIPLWRLTRNRYARRLYDGLAAVGVTATRMVEYEATPGAADSPVGSSDRSAEEGSADVTVFAAPTGDDRLDGLDLEFSIPASFLDGEWVVVARTPDRAVGRALVSAGQRPYVDPLGTELSFDGAYVRRVFVVPDRRAEGIATRLVRAALATAESALDADSAHALVAADNRPSQWVFESTGFRPVRRHDYVRLLGLERRRTAPLE